MSTHTTRLVKTLGLVVINVALAACGGGGGYSGGTTGNTTYTGKTTAAIITTANGQGIATNTFLGGDIGTAVSTRALTDPGAARIDLPRIPTLEKILNSTLEKIHPTPESGNPLQAMVVSVSNKIIPGTCPANPGNISINFSYDDTTGNMSGSGTFNKFCENGVTSSGVISISGLYNSTKNDFDKVTLSISDLTTATAHDSFTVSGTMTADRTKTPTVVTMDIPLMRDNTTNAVYKFENATLTEATDASQNLDFTMSGRFFSPSDGYVDVSTPVPLHINKGDNWPSSGQMKVTGQNNSSATLKALSNTTYQVDVDQNGDGIIDSTTTGNWVNL